MTQPSRKVPVDFEDVPKEIQDLAHAIGDLPDEQRRDLEALLDKATSSARRRRRILHLVQDALSQLRLDMKYLMFDLEATRRERDEYRKRAENSD